MAASNPYQALLRTRIRSAIDEANAASRFTHPGVKGTVLEVLVGKIFRPLLPADIGVGTGQIIDAYGSQMSDQVDIVLYDKSILPPILIDENIGLFPVESVLYTIEVKTTLDSAGLLSAHRSAAKLSKFCYLPGMIDQLGKAKDHAVEKLRSVVFALRSDLTGTQLTEAARYKKIYGDDPAHIRSICVAGRSYWYDNGEHWITCEHTDQYDEVLAFVGGITNTYRSVSESRHSPLLGHYVIPDGKGSRTIDSRRVAKLKVACDRCGKEGLLKPSLGKLSITVNGSVSSNEPCSACGGIFHSEPGKYRFVNGELVEGAEPAPSAVGSP